MFMIKAKLTYVHLSCIKRSGIACCTVLCVFHCVLPTMLIVSRTIGIARSRSGHLDIPIVLISTQVHSDSLSQDPYVIVHVSRPRSAPTRSTQTHVTNNKTRVTLDYQTRLKSCTMRNTLASKCDQISTSHDNVMHSGLNYIWQA